MKPLLKDASEADKAQWIPRKLLKPENLHRSPHSQETFIAENTNTSIQTLNHIYICVVVVQVPLVVVCTP